MTHFSFSFFFFFIFLGVIEFCLLAAKSSDHYISICKQLHYMSIMNHRDCTLLVLASWLASSLIIFSHSCCSDNLIMPLIILIVIISPFTHFLFRHQIARDDGLSSAVFTLMFSLLIILSYPYTIRTILRISSTTQRTRGFFFLSFFLFFWLIVILFQRDGMGREEGGGFRVGNTCTPVADSF